MSVRALRNISGRAGSRTLRNNYKRHQIGTNLIQKRFKDGWHFDPLGPDSTFLERWAVRDS